MKPFSPLLPLALFSVLLAAYGGTTTSLTEISTLSTATDTLSTAKSVLSTAISTLSTTNNALSTANSTLSTANSTLLTTSTTSSSSSSTSSPQPCTSSTCPTTPYNISESFCLFSSTSQEFKNEFENGTCPNDSDIRNITDFFIPCELMCLWNPFVTDIIHTNTTIIDGFCPKSGYCGVGVSMFKSCNEYRPCLRGLDCNGTFKVCLQTEVLIILPTLTVIAIVLGIYISRRLKYRGQVRLNDEDDGATYFHDNGSVADAKNMPISLPTLVYKPNRGEQDDGSMGKRNISPPRNGGLRTDDLMLFGNQTK